VGLACLDSLEHLLKSGAVQRLAGFVELDDDVDELMPLALDEPLDHLALHVRADEAIAVAAVDVAHAHVTDDSHDQGLYLLSNGGEDHRVPHGSRRFPERRRARRGAGDRPLACRAAARTGGPVIHGNGLQPVPLAVRSGTWVLRNYPYLLAA